MAENPDDGRHFQWTARIKQKCDGVGITGVKINYDYGAHNDEIGAHSRRL